MRCRWPTACSVQLLLLALPIALQAKPIQNILQLGSSDASRVAFYPPLSYSTAWDGDNGGRGEPLNVIISGLSHASILTQAGLLKYVKTLGFEPECLNLHFGGAQTAHLADGNDWHEQVYEIRQAYFPIFGTCVQSAVGGNHFRAWKQNGTLADSGAWFLALSLEYDFRRYHNIKPNGYDHGRDDFARAAHRGHHHYVSDVKYLDLIQPGRKFNHGISTDGRVALIRVDLH
ncbi:MAG: hypothetical protein CYPHOPRED_006111 [Cyphobasidiales sp. Tagirdzhanova-0007]|nr:MAG: hypothetical protein CYPHOPRED_006111 [Cyphobasidiales sp. Tagirdzhanova-0007]